MKYSSAVLFFLAVIAVSVSVVQAGYSVDLTHVPGGPSDTLGTDGLISFFDLPLWIQCTWAISFLVALLGAIKFGPLLIGKVRAIIQNKNRVAILDYIGNNPGCTLADLSKNTGINRGTAKYHLYLLAIKQEIVMKKDGKLGYLFTNGGRHLEKKRVYGYIMNPAKREILETIRSRPGISNKQIADCLNLDPSTIHWHLRQFLDEEMVVSRWDGRNLNYFLFPDVENILKESRK
jgi:predicted transcriptional regulator